MMVRKTALLVATATVLLVSVVQYHDRQSRRQEAVRLRATNDQMRLQASQRREATQRSPAHLADGTNGSIVSPAVQSERSHDKSMVKKASGPIPGIPRAAETDYRNEGQATPLNALQTFAWACDRGDATMMKKLLAFDAAARVKAERYFASLSEQERTQWVSLDAMAASVYLSDGMKHPYPGAEILQLARFETVNAGRVVLHLPGANGDGYEFQFSGEEWKLAITETVVDDYIKESSRASGGP